MKSLLMHPLYSLSLLLSTVSAGYTPVRHVLSKRDTLPQCTDLTIASNNGNRKVAIVVDCSLSMQDNDPTGHRVAAARSLNQFLLTKSESGTPDLVTIIEFGGGATLNYELGDPGEGADAAIGEIDSDTWGTFIASGVEMAVEQLTSGGGDTPDRSAIVVLTDGEDNSPDSLLEALKDADSRGIRVSFGFLSTSVGSQAVDILAAIRDTRGIYATIADAAGSQNFVNYAILNGLTYQDNPQGYNERLLAGLGQTYTVSGDGRVVLRYGTQQGEAFNFTIAGISTGVLSARVTMGGQVLDSVEKTVDPYIEGTAPAGGDVELEIRAHGAPANALFSVQTNSNVPLKNCTVGVRGADGLTTGAKAGIGIGVIAAIGAIGAGGYFALQHMQGLASPHPPPNMTSTGGEIGHDPFGGTEKLHPEPKYTPMDQTVMHDPSGMPNGGGGGGGENWAPQGGTGAEQTTYAPHGSTGGTGGVGESGTGGIGGAGDVPVGPQGGPGGPGGAGGPSSYGQPGFGAQGGTTGGGAGTGGPAGGGPLTTLPNLPPGSQGAPNSWSMPPLAFMPPRGNGREDPSRTQGQEQHVLGYDQPDTQVRHHYEQQQQQQHDQYRQQHPNHYQQHQQHPLQQHHPQHHPNNAFDSVHQQQQQSNHDNMQQRGYENNHHPYHGGNQTGGPQDVQNHHPHYPHDGVDYNHDNQQRQGPYDGTGHGHENQNHLDHNYQQSPCDGTQRGHESQNHQQLHPTQHQHVVQANEPPAQPDKVPALHRTKVQKHHHHEWMVSPDEFCADPECMLNSSRHRCWSAGDDCEAWGCPCTCRAEGCPVTQDREAQAFTKDMLGTVAKTGAGMAL